MRSLLRTLKWLLAGAVLLVLAYQVWVFAHLLWWTQFNPSQTRFMSLRLDEMRERKPDAQLRHQWVPYERISVHLKRAVIAAEDDAFVDHEGFDWEGIQKAMEKNRKKGRAVAGGSTISQQLAKNLFLSPSRSYVRKAQEAAITFMMEAVMDKRRILEIYLNVVEWGDGVFGAEAAAQRYYRIPAAKLGPEQAARLAVMLPNPRKYEKTFGPRLAAHAARIAGRMHYSQVP
ncbi:MAG: monofunctional biosynthetic peptidoglycan transglycosylase [Methyloversatilis sp.]|jgi:monofunctional biosynthetic peptidoglycan transglycosylase|uniref:monofunctional biosynthetic peptidoglycan transglycosylase n=1 Tax=Methyloversatilis discipulorum TaxID=1119528 RepID=UPI000DB756F2|nr:monofunctional biosynthetic peptidoglycan transglycosylase [Methyloversatilis discipulorum]MBC7208190.1 monofunctional biosynthetic peptidoglycan transglycosylase [Methyloversatilis sp.]MBT9518777.1 monofunctional biosynthetic peptidoglycan transglycosylase [Methyloversatilis discipulorum]PZU52578.1 MAG: monofunctional biosynthetic peptidoglycan transglycosylase [Thauera sp.]